MGSGDRYQSRLDSDEANPVRCVDECQCWVLVIGQWGFSEGFEKKVKVVHLFWILARLI